MANSTHFWTVSPTKAFMVLHLFVKMKSDGSFRVKSEKGSLGEKFRSSLLSHLCTPDQALFEVAVIVGLGLLGAFPPIIRKVWREGFLDDVQQCNKHFGTTVSDATTA